MSIGLFAVVALAGGAGAGARWIVDVALGRVLRARFPWAILLINVTGSFALGGVTGASAALDAAVIAAVGTGLLGGYTTFSTVAVESVLLWERRQRRLFWANVLGNAAAALAAAALGVLAGSVAAGAVLG